MTASAAPQSDGAPSALPPPIPFLEVEPPHWVARGLAWLLLAFFAVALLASVLVKVPETVTGEFVLVPLRGTDPVRAARQGVVAEVLATEGIAVTDGQPLFTIRSPTIADRAAELRTLQADLTSTDSALANMDRQYQTQRVSDLDEEKRLEGRLGYLTRMSDLKARQLKMTTDLAQQMHSGVQSGSVGQVEYSRTELDAARLAEESEQVRRDRDDTQAAIVKLRHDRETRLLQYRDAQRTMEAKREAAKIRIGGLEQELGHGGESQLTAKAPCEGTVVRMEVNASGAVVPEGAVLAEVACAGEHLQGDVVLPQSGVPLVHAGQGVKLRYDAFPYQRYGVRYGTVRWVGPASVTPRDTAAFRAFVEIRDTTIRVRGQARALLAGMRGRADVVVGRRTLVSYVFEPLRQLKESFAEVPKP